MNGKLETLAVAILNARDALSNTVESITQLSAEPLPMNDPMAFASAVGMLAAKHSNPKLAADLHETRGLFGGLWFTAKALLSDEEFDWLVRRTGIPLEVIKLEVIGTAMTTKTSIWL